MTGPDCGTCSPGLGRADAAETLLKVTVVIPCYNAADYVGDAIRSSLAQTWQNMEIIVIDDGSTDLSADIVRSFGDTVQFESGPNRGGCAARNRGLTLATGDFVQFLDADDLLKPTCIAAKMAYVAEDPTAMPVSDVEYQFVDGTTQVNTWTAPSGDPFCGFVRSSPITVGPLHRRSDLVSIGGFREALPCAQEFDLHVRLALHGATYRRLPEVQATMRQVPGSVSSNHLRMTVTIAKLLEEWYYDLERRQILYPERRELLAHGLAHRGRYLVGNGDAEAGRHALSLARKVHPNAWELAYHSNFAKIVARLIGPAPAETMFGMARKIRGRA